MTIDTQDIIATISAMVTVKDAAQEIGISRQTVQDHIGSGKLKATLIGSKLFITRAELDRFKAIPRVSGAKKKNPAPDTPQPESEPESEVKRKRGRPRKKQ